MHIVLRNSNLMAFKYWILDWQIWYRAPYAIQKLVFQSIADVVGTTENANFNIKRLEEAGLVQAAFDMFKDKDYLFPEKLGLPLISVLQVVQKPPSSKDLQLILQYLVATHSSPSIGQNETLVVNLSQMMTPRKVKKVISFDTPSLYNNQSSKSVPPTPSTPHSISDSVGLRILVVEMLLDFFKDYAGCVEAFAELCSIELLFALLRVESTKVRILLLQVLDFYLMNATLLAKFKEMKGFELLGKQLSTLSISEDLFGALFQLLLGRSALPKPSVPSSPLRSYFVGQIQDAKLQHPDAISTILSVCCVSAPEYQHYVIKTLHSIFLQNDKIKQQMIDDGKRDFLCGEAIWYLEFDQQSMI